MEDPTARAGWHGRLRRACQRNRLEKQIMSDAYEFLVPILTGRCGRPGEGTTSRPGLEGLGDGPIGQACSAGGGL